MSGDRLLEVGRVTRAHGIRGDVLVELVTDREDRLAPGSLLRTGEGLDDPSAEGVLEVVSSRPHQGRHIVTFAGVADRSAAERLRGTVLRAEALDDPDALWVHELIGAEVVDGGGRVRGRVVAVEANPASDLLVLDGGHLVPLRFVVDHDPGRRVTVDPPEGLFDG